MTRVLGSIALLLIVVAAVGFYRGWFIAQSTNAPDQSQIDVTVNKNAIHQDETKVQAEAREAGEKLRDRLSPTTVPATNP